MQKVSEAFLKVNEWLGANAAQIKESLNLEISLENESKLLELSPEKLPMDFLDMYRCHDGIDDEKVANLFFGMTFYTSQKVIQSYGNISQSDSFEFNYADEGIIPSYSKELIRVPFGDDSGKCGLYCDLSPSEGGEYGQIIFIDHEYKVALKLAASTTALVQDFSNDLEQGVYLLAEDALEDGVHWLSPIREKDPGNWFNSPTWSHLRAKLNMRQK